MRVELAAVAVELSGRKVLGPVSAALAPGQCPLFWSRSIAA